MTYAEAEAFLFDLPRFAEQGAAAMKPGLERMEALLGAMGGPHTRFRSVHVAGTNGKGSTASMVAAVATAAGLRTGLHTSPHLHDLAERLRLDGLPAPHGWIADAVARHRADFEAVGPSFFEATVALSFLYFAEQAVDLAVVEVGLGGRLDATNVLCPEVALVTSIGLDHADLLGDTVEAVAREKAGIAKPGVPLLTSAEGEGVLAALRETAEARGAVFRSVWDEVQIRALDDPAGGVVLDLTTPVRTYERLEIGLPGRHQAGNAALAVRAAEAVVGAVATDAGPVRAGLAEVRKLSGLAARCEVIQHEPLVLADVAHNADGLRAALAWAQGLASGTLYVLFGTMADKDLAAMTDELRRSGAVALPVDLLTPRAVPQDALRRALADAGVPVRAVTDAADALAWYRRRAVPGDALLAAGSHLVAADVRRASVS